MGKMFAALLLSVFLFGCLGAPSAPNAPGDGFETTAARGDSNVAAPGRTATLTGEQICTFLSGGEVASACGLGDKTLVQTPESAGCLYSFNNFPVLNVQVQDGARIVSDVEKQTAKAGVTAGGAEIGGENEIRGVDYSFRFTIGGLVSSALVIYKGERYVSLTSADLTGGSDPAAACSSQELVSLGQKVADKV